MPPWLARIRSGGAGSLRPWVAERSRRRAGRTPGRGPIVLRLSHSMSAGPTALHVFGDKFRELAEAATGGAVTVRVFPSGTLGQEREVVQQLQEGLVDFMVSGTAIWGSVAPRLQVVRLPVPLARLGPRARGRRRAGRP